MLFRRCLGRLAAQREATARGLQVAHHRPEGGKLVVRGCKRCQVPLPVPFDGISPCVVVGFAVVQRIRHAQQILGLGVFAVATRCRGAKSRQAFPRQPIDRLVAVARRLLDCRQGAWVPSLFGNGQANVRTGIVEHCTGPRRHGLDVSHRPQRILGIGRVDQRRAPKRRIVGDSRRRISALQRQQPRGGLRRHLAIGKALQQRLRIAELGERDEAHPAIRVAEKYGSQRILLAGIQRRDGSDPLGRIGGIQPRPARQRRDGGAEPLAERLGLGHGSTLSRLERLAAIVD